jgi:Ca-activated chloride channel family protein
MVEFLGIYWAGAHRIIFLPFFAFFIFLIIRNYVRVRKNVDFLVHKDTQKYMFKHFSLRVYLVKTIFLCISLFLLFLAIMQPQWGKKEVMTQQEGRDLLIALDISRSMLAKDLSPTRLEFIKLKIKHLLQMLDFDRVGLILFSGSAFLQCPLTADHDAFLMFLDQVDVETIASGTTSIGAALSEAIEVFSHAERKNKLVLLATDGEDFSVNLQQIKAKAEQEHILLFSLGVGTLDGAPIPIVDVKGNIEGHEVDDKGNIVLTKLNETLLRDISQDLGGNYFRVTYDDSDIDGLVHLIKRYEKEKFEERKISYYHDQYPWLLGVACVLLLLEWIL